MANSELFHLAIIGRRTSGKQHKTRIYYSQSEKGIKVELVWEIRHASIKGTR